MFDDKNIRDINNYCVEFKLTHDFWYAWEVILRKNIPHYVIWDDVISISTKQLEAVIEEIFESNYFELFVLKSCWKNSNLGICLHKINMLQARGIHKNINFTWGLFYKQSSEGVL